VQLSQAAAPRLRLIPLGLKQYKKHRHLSVLFILAGAKDLFQTFGTQDEVEIEQEIKEIRALFSNANEEDLRRLRDEGTADEVTAKKGT
jgi:hypothetical protein